MKKDKPLTEKQLVALKKCPDEEFTYSAFPASDRNYLYALLHKGYLNRFRCDDPSDKKLSFSLTEKGKQLKRGDLPCS
jgi:hypothetical protein